MAVWELRICTGSFEIDCGRDLFQSGTTVERDLAMVLVSSEFSILRDNSQ